MNQGWDADGTVTAVARAAGAMPAIAQYPEGGKRQKPAVRCRLWHMAMTRLCCVGTEVAAERLYFY